MTRVEQYIELSIKLIRARESGITDEVESSYVDDLDRLWWGLTKDEREVAQQLLLHIA